MQGIGELFGSAFDDVIRRPAPVAAPIVADVTLLLVGALVYSASVGLVLFGQAPQALPQMPFAVPDALPSVTDLRDVTARVLAEGPRGWLAVAGVAAVTVPIGAYARGGFVGVLLEAYQRRRDDPLTPEPSLYDTFHSYGQRHMGPLVVLGLLEAAVAVAAVMLPAVALPYFENTLLGLVVFDFLLLFAPYVVVVENRGAFSAIRRSVRTVSDYLASSLVALLFGLLVTGGVAAILGPVVAFFGATGLVLGAVLYAPVGAVLSLFYLKVYLSFRPHDRFPARAQEAATKATAPAEA